MNRRMRIHDHSASKQGRGGARALGFQAVNRKTRAIMKGEQQRETQLSSQQRSNEALCNAIPDNDDREYEPMDTFADDILQGNSRVEISAAGEETLGGEIYGAVAANHQRTHRRRQRKDERKRWKRSELIYRGFTPQMEAIANAWESFELWQHENGPNARYSLPEGATPDGAPRRIFVVDILAAQYQDVQFAGDTFVADGLVRQGLFPCSPYFPSLAFTANVLNLFHRLHLRCPRLGKQAFIRTLCDMHGTAPREYLEKQLAVSYNLYLRTKEVVRLRVAKELGRDTPNWRLKNACPCCLYKVKGEGSLDPPFIVTMDGNNSLKRFQRRERITLADGTTMPGSSVESIDSRPAPRDYYLSPEFVDLFDKANCGELPEGPNVGCGDGWKNMDEKYTSKAWGMYRETGIFLLLCRHSMVLSICDMINSGEAAKYGLATIAHLLEVLGACLIGYDIGCQFHAWAMKNPKLAPLYLRTLCKAIVGAFHGAGHHRLCQLVNLPLYNKGCGLEAMENGEPFFSKSNALAGVTRYATRFHRQQAIVEYLAHSDVYDAYANISSLLATKYRNALEILDSLPALEEGMKRLNIQSRDVFETWLEEQRERLERSTVVELTAVEELRMEYVQKLVNLHDPKDKMDQLMNEDVAMDDETRATRGNADLERRRRQATERYDRTLDAVHSLERKLAIRDRWTPGSSQWNTAANLRNEQRYRQALDKVQKLVIARLLELGKVNLRSTCYKMRQLIAKALQNRSKALRKAIDDYNIIARILKRQILDWDQVVEYAFVADFDLLRLHPDDVDKAMWAHPGARELMDLHFRLLRAHEELFRLNIEIKGLVTYIRDEERFLLHHIRRLEGEGKWARALQVQKYAMAEGRFNALHIERLTKLSKLPGFTGDLSPGESLSEERQVPMEGMRSGGNVPLQSSTPAPPQGLLADDAEEGEVAGVLSKEEMEVLQDNDGYDGDYETDAEDEEVGNAVEKVLDITGDGEGEGEGEVLIAEVNTVS
ncbi:hypothetical protein MKEN_00402500 [Mycena kentingensis (nom. inval.)]|nr:hypothetical protein MKEN_00402500 [Mycena kentingensis (nom. inval.)]